MHIDIHTHKIQYKNKDSLLIVNIDVLTRHTNILPKKTNYSIGLHPWSIDRVQDLTMTLELIDLLSKKENCFFIGETGLDYARIRESKELQKEIFKQHIYLAKKNHRPLILHCVKAYDETVKILVDEKFNLPVVFHDFNGSKEIMEVILKQENFYLSLGRALWRKNSRILKYLNKIPLERIFFETDDSQIEIKEVYQHYCLITGQKEELVIKQIICNFKKISPYETKGL